ncbi:flavin monoamine oxidase family protein [Bradyrhizobium erythrophlei]|uniref:Tryptophan 2-monooxygenase n=1 Tax=Bradyrhizobium erythrophlei TaxID=1437360 RepID=A0A1M5QS59_9BRAD|nr:NAD(P)/FAD-dependent oxidoreductase [Bradyrhizobium erythrophlei]SHH16610.1 monoamine oxidase [Bradyrhizobium erythrophlei]
MSRPTPDHIVVIGAGAAGLMAARELGRAGKRVTLLEARDRCGGRIDPLSAAEFGYPAEGGAEFIHGEAPVTRALLREAGISLLPIEGRQWRVEGGGLSRESAAELHEAELHKALRDLKDDVAVAEFLRRHFAGPEYARLRHSIERMVEGYDAADPERASTLALRDEWMGGGRGTQNRIAGGYGALIDFLLAECRSHGAEIHLGAVVTAIDVAGGGAMVRCADGDTHACDCVVLTAPLPVLRDITLPPTERERAAAAADIGFGNVIKILTRFETRWWLDGRKDLADLSFLLSDARIPVWWTQHPADLPVLTGWFGGPKTQVMAELGEQELIQAGLASLAGIFGVSAEHIARDLVAALAINWAHDPFARGAYSYATPETRAAQSVLSGFDGGAILFSGEALYRGRDMGTVEAALTSGRDTARTILGR